MIPKTIHYCWFGKKPLPKLAQKCIASWRKFLPDYDIKEWNESNFNVNIIPYTKEAYAAKKYAFVSDYARFFVLYNYGGLYFDTDVEVIQSLDRIIERGAFMGCENNGNEKQTIKVAPGLGLGAPQKMTLYKDLLDLYSTLHFINQDGTQNIKTVVEYTTELLSKHGLKDTDKTQLVDNIYIYPKDFFCPKSQKDGRIKLTGNTYTIHHFTASWQQPHTRIKEIFKLKLRRILINILGENTTDSIIKFKKKCLMLF